LLTASILSILLLVAGCGDQSTSPVRTGGPVITEGEQRVIDTNNAFGLNLFREIDRAGKADENIFISPLSASMALGMTANGARTTTLEAMMNTLGFSGLSMYEMNSSYRSIIEMLTGLDPETVFEIANSIWYREGRVFRQEFLDTCGTYFDAVVRPLDFSADGAADTINAWVEDKTHGKIDEIIEPPIGSTVVMYLINAIYFLGSWTYEFDPDLTSEAPFYLPDGSSLTCSIMQRPGEEEKCEYMYLSNASFQAVDLPYGDGWYGMTVFLPAYGVGIDSLIGELTIENWDAWMAGFEEDEGTLYLPRFEIEYDLLMNDALISLGMGIAFDPAGADFTGMRDEGGLWINRVIHKTYVKVDEEGTEAAAVTAVEMVETSVGSFVMRVDRPFIFAIREKHSGTILFIGKIVNPGA
jgi:serpin B